MFILEHNFLISLASYLLYYSNYIILYFFMYIFFYQNSAKVIFQSLWEKHNQKSLLAAKTIDDNKQALQNARIIFYSKKTQYTKYLEQLHALGKIKKQSHQDLQARQEKYDFARKQYNSAIINKIKIEKQKELQVLYVHQILLSYASQWDDFTFLEFMQSIKRSSND